jgi:hypothetical protein
MDKKTRQALSPRTRPYGDTLLEFSQNTWRSFEEVWSAIERLETNSLMGFEELKLSGTWAAVSGPRSPAIKFIGADTAVLRGEVTNPSGPAYNTAIGTLPPSSRPRFQTRAFAMATDTGTVIPVILTITAAGVITPTWAVAPVGAYQIVLDNVFIHLA